MGRWVEKETPFLGVLGRLCGQDPDQHAGPSRPFPTSIVAHFTLRPASVSPLGERACPRLRDNGCGGGGSGCSRDAGNRRGAGAGRCQEPRSAPPRGGGQPRSAGLCAETD